MIYQVKGLGVVTKEHSGVIFEGISSLGYIMNNVNKCVGCTSASLVAILERVEAVTQYVIGYSTGEGFKNL